MAAVRVSRVVAATAVAVVRLAVAGALSAKSTPRATVCGASGCRDGEAWRLTPIDGVPFTSRTAPKPAPYYSMTLHASGQDGFCWRLVWVPSRHALRVENLGPTVIGAPVAGGYWRSVHERLAANLTRSARGLRPYPASRAWRAPRLCR